jgi:hypothetical protein
MRLSLNKCLILQRYMQTKGDEQIREKRTKTGISQRMMLPIDFALDMGEGPDFIVIPEQYIKTSFHWVNCMIDFSLDACYDVTRSTKNNMI